MKILQPTIQILDEIDSDAIFRKLDRIARVCYQSEPKNGNVTSLIKNCIKRGHESVIEHVSITFDLHTDIGVLAELTRHRLAAYSVESTRYVKYNKSDKDGEGTMEFMEPIEFHGVEYKGYDLWKRACEYTERLYCKMMDLPNMRSDLARNVLNESNKCQIVFTMNLRELRSMFKLRCEKPAHAHIKQVMIPLLFELKKMVPVIFDDIEYDHEFVRDYLGYYYEESSQTIYTHPIFKDDAHIDDDDSIIDNATDNVSPNSVNPSNLSSPSTNYCSCVPSTSIGVEVNGVVQNSSDILYKPKSLDNFAKYINNNDKNKFIK